MRPRDSVLEFDEPAAAVIKPHEPASGAATGASPAEAYLRAREADSLAAFGGIVALNRLCRCGHGRTHRLDVHRGRDRACRRRRRARDSRAQSQHARGDRGFHPAQKRRCRGAVDSERCSRRSATASLRRTSRGAAASTDGLRIVTKRLPTDEEWEALRFAWRICAHVKSNTVVFTDAQRTLAIGAGRRAASMR